MNDIQTGPSETDLITAIRANLSEFYRHLSRRLPEGHFSGQGLIGWRTPLQHPWFNGVLSARVATEDDESLVEQVLDYFRAGKVGTFTWWLEPALEPSDWAPLLARYDFRFSDDTPGMAVDLQALNEPTQTVEGLEIRAVEDSDGLLTWAQVFARGYGLPAAWVSSVYDVWLELGLDLPIRNYLGFLNGEPVATSSVLLGGGAAGIYSVATLKEARGQGIGAAMTFTPLQEARRMGYRIGVLESSDMGYNVYKKLGFRHLCQIEYFYRKLP